MANPAADAERNAFLKYFFQELASRLPIGQNMAGILEDMLQVSKGNVYKRMRGELPLSISEVVLLAKKYDISLDEWLFRDTGRVSMHFMSLLRPVQSPLEFLRRLHYLLARASQLSGLAIHYATTEMAGFQYLAFPELTAFKFHMWNRTTWAIAAYDQPWFSPALYTEDTELETARMAFLALWDQTPTCEYWQLHTLENTLSQLRYMAYEGSFEQPEMPRLLGEQLMELINIWEKMANTGRKPPGRDQEGRELPGAAFTLYHNEIFHTNNVFLLDSPDRKRVVMTFDNPNNITTENEAFGNYTAAFFQKIRAHSQRISEEGEKQRRRFFSALRVRVLTTNEEIKSIPAHK